MTTANKITITRILLIPVFVGLILAYSRNGQESFRIGALAVFALVSAGDALDGFVARHYNQRSKLGAVLDPLADKLLLMSSMVVLTFGDHRFLEPFPLWLMATALARDLIILWGVAMVRSRVGTVVVRAHITGKMATVLQMTIVIWILLRFPHGFLPPVELAAGGFTAAAAIFYILDGVRQFYSHSPTHE